MAHRTSKNSFAQNVREVIFILLAIFIIRTVFFGLYQVPTGSMERTMLVGERFLADKFTYTFLRKPQRGEIIAFNDPLYPYSESKFKRLFEYYVWGPMNWTKRVIGVPGDEVRGVIENGKPVVYLNGNKLDEPYLNPYPLIHLYRESISQLKERLRRDYGAALRFGLGLSGVSEWRTYDPERSYQDQPFYRMSEDRIGRTAEGKPELRWPHTPTYSQRALAHVSPGTNHWDGSDEFYVKLSANEYWLMGDNRQGSKDSRFIGPVSGELIHGRIVLLIWSLDSVEPWWIVDLIKHPIDFWMRIRKDRFFQWLG